MRPVADFYRGLFDNPIMAKSETNVRVPPCALVALDQVKAVRGVRSRDETMRQLLAEYVEKQRVLDPAERLTTQRSV